MSTPQQGIRRPGLSGDEYTVERVLAYLRVSTVEAAETGTSLDTQRSRLQDFAHAQGWPDPIFFSDDGVSGARSDRPQLLNLLDTLRPGDIVLVAAIDRLARSLKLLLDILERVDETGAIFHSLREGWDTSTLMGRFGLQLVGAVAELERGMISERTRDGHRSRRAQGKLSGGRVLFGYQRGPEGFPVEVPEQAATVRLIFHMYTAERLGALRIARELERRAVRSPSNTLDWAESQVDRIITNPAYVGRHRSGVKYPPIIDEETWRLVPRRRVTNRHVKPSSGGRRWPLQGRITCECGSAWRVNTGRKTRRTYFCSGRESRIRRARDGHRCTIPRQPADELERAVWLALVDALTDADSFAHAIDAAIADLRAREEELERGARPIREGLDEVRRRKERLGERRLADAFSAERFSDLLAEHERREAELKRQLNDLGPDLEEELTRAQELLRGAERLKRNALRRAERGLPIGVFSLDPELAESCEVDMFRGANVWQITNAEPDDLPSALTEALDRLQMDIIAHPGRLELRGLVAFDATLPRPELRGPHTPQVGRGSR